MNVRKLLIFFVLFGCLSYYYLHHEVADREHKKGEEEIEEKVLALPKNESIDFLHIEFESNLIELKKEQGMWKITEPVTDEADQFTVNGIVSAISIDKRMRDFSDTAFDYAEIGLLPPQIRIGVGYAGKKRFLLVGDETPVGGFCYARWEGADDVFLVSQNFSQAIKKNLWSVRNKRLFTFDVPEASVLQMHMTDGNLFFEKMPDKNGLQWWIVEPFENRAHDGLVREYLSQIQRITISTFHDDRKPLAEYGVDPAVMRIVIKVTDQKDQKLIIGNLNEEAKTYFGYVPTRDIVVEVAQDVIDGLKKEPESFIDKRVNHMPDLLISSITYEKGDRKEVFSKINEAWYRYPMTPEKNKDAHVTDQIEKLIFFVSGLPYEKVITADAISDFNISEETCICTVSFRKEEPLQKFVFNFYETDNEFFVTCNDDPNLYTVNSDLYDELNALLKEILQ